MAATISYYKYSGPTQWKGVLSQSWRPEVQNRGVGRAALPPEALGTDSTLPLPVSDGFRRSLACGLRNSNLCLHLHIASSTVSHISLGLSLIRIFVIGFTICSINPGLSHPELLYVTTLERPFFQISFYLQSDGIIISILPKGTLMLRGVKGPPPRPQSCRELFAVRL